MKLVLKDHDIHHLQRSRSIHRECGDSSIRKRSTNTAKAKIDHENEKHLVCWPGNNIAELCRSA